MQHIVTASEADARKAIGYLKSRNAGRATFLPLDVMRSRKIQPSALSRLSNILNLLVRLTTCEC